MIDKRKALGRGLDSLLPGKAPVSSGIASSAPARGLHEVAVELIDPNPYQTRRRINEDALKELADSIRASGVVQPIMLRPGANGRFQLVAGERRWLASKRAGKLTVPAVVKQISNEQAMEITIVENLQREDLNPIEQARAFERLSREFSLTQEQIATRTGKDRASIANFIRLLKLPAAVQDALENGALTFGHGKVLGGLTGFPEQLQKAVERVISKSLSVRQTEAMVSELLNPEAARRRAKAALDPNVREAQRTLEQRLGVKVEIMDRKGKGKIILKYGSLEDFDRIVAALAAK
ncbi:MAG TPA: ParB/RepB/Spo0J family partition protein [Candidatus Angelobacter sp.]|nr:ParB/RepB/Spo0J family partition protein [Candidatus Angelobacter sp.]